MALALAMMALIEPGDEVLYPDPGFPIYPSFTRGLGAKAVPFFLEEKNQFQPDIAEISRENHAAYEGADLQFSEQSDRDGFQRRIRSRKSLLWQ